MALWTINGADISMLFGVYLKKGSYNELLKYPTMKDDIEEDVREEDGVRLLKYVPRAKARDVSLSFYIEAADLPEFWCKYDLFRRFLYGSGVFPFRLAAHNRCHMLAFKGGESYTETTMLTGRGGRKFGEVKLTFREPNPMNVTAEVGLQMEDGAQAHSEGGLDLFADINYLNIH